MGDDEYGPATAARAKWDFVPEEPSGLALTADDELEVWPTEKGRWFARKRRGGYEGYVPRDYVRVEGRHAEAAFPGISARVAAISPRREEPPRNDDEDELQLALALSLSEAEAAAAVASSSDSDSDSSGESYSEPSSDDEDYRAMWCSKAS